MYSVYSKYGYLIGRTDDLGIAKSWTNASYIILGDDVVWEKKDE